MAATSVLDFIQKPGYVQAEKEFNVLLQHFELLFAALGGDASAVLGEWSSLCCMVAGDPVLRAVPLTELYSRVPFFISSPCTTSVHFYHGTAPERLKTCSRVKIETRSLKNYHDIV